ncbi:MAG: hypothetical protein QM758_29375 [Armatimonas sp.]
MFEFLTKPNIVQAIVIWIGAACTLGIYSILYKENKVFRFFEHLFIGLGTGYTIAVTWNDILGPRWWAPMVSEGKWYYFFSLPGGLLFYFVYSKRHAWLSRLVFGISFGAAAGLAFQGFAAKFFPQLQKLADTRFSDLPEAKAPDAYVLTPISAALNNLLGLVILACVMTYFFFSFESKGKAAVLTNKMSTAGRWVLMFAFGAIFGSTIMARMSLLIGRMYFLIHDWAVVTIFHGK